MTDKCYCIIMCGRTNQDPLCKYAVITQIFRGRKSVECTGLGVFSTFAYSHNLDFLMSGIMGKFLCILVLFNDIFMEMPY